MPSTTALSYYHRAKTLESQPQWQEAIEYYHQAIRLDPDYAEAYGSLGNLWQQHNQWEAAFTCYQQVLRIWPDCGPAYGNLGNIFAAKQQWELAKLCYQQVLRGQPQAVETYYRLAEVLRAQRQFEAELTCYQEILRLQPDAVQSYVKLSEVYAALGQLPQALNCYTPALQRQPQSADLHFQYALWLLKLGDFQAGWEEYEWRLKSSTIEFSLPRPRWDGSPLAGRRLLVHWEQGFGDTIQFVRYLRLIQGGTVIFASQPALATLWSGVAGIDEVIINESGQLPNVAYDVWISLLSLPRLFATTIANLPAIVPYIYPAAEKVASWQSRFNPAQFNIGLVWAGSPTHQNDSNRSCPLAYFAPLAKLPQVAWFSLQKGPAVSQPLPPLFKLTFLHEELNDFSDTAAVIAGLDLVITVDTAVAHLAGAMGKPVWVLLPLVSDWRWMTDREDSPWYPTMRLFRQPRFGDWQSVLAKVKEELEAIKSQRN